MRGVAGIGKHNYDKVEKNIFEETHFENIGTSNNDDEDIIEMHTSTSESIDNKNIPVTSTNCSEGNKQELQNQSKSNSSEVITSVLQWNDECSQFSDDSDYIPDLSVIEEEDHPTISESKRKRHLRTV